jgi:hypothetical protein
MRKTFLLLTVAALFASGFATGALAHGGKSHKLLGTVEAVEEDQLVLTTTAGEQATVTLTAETRCEKDGKEADRSALVPGARVAIDLSEDDTTAVKIKIGTGGGQHDGSR